MIDIKSNRIRTATIDTDAMGVELSWAFGNSDNEAVTIPRPVVGAILVANSFSTDYLSELTPSDALKRAAELAPNRKALSVKELARPNSDSPRVFGIYCRVAVPGERGDTWVMGARVRAVGDEIVAMPPEGAADMLMAARPAAETMERQANALLTNVFNQDIGMMLTSIGRDQGWISRRRNSGGVYYMQTGARAEAFVALLLDLKAETASHHISRQFIPEIIEVFPRPLTQATIADAATHHFEAKITTLVDQLRKAADNGKMREGTMDKRVAEIDALMVQAEEYRTILDQGATELRSRLNDVRTHYRTAIAGGCEALESELAAFDAIAPPAPKATPTPAKVAPTPAPVEAPAQANPFAGFGE